jgi:CHAT domain-containing protein
VQGVGVLEALAERRRRSPSPYARVLAVGDPWRPDWPELPSARREVAAIHAMFPDSEPPLVGEGATIKALAALVGRADVLHLACHAERVGTPEGTARLLLAPAPHVPDSGVLSEDRIAAELALPGGCLVNLAGCATAVQAVRDDPILGGLVPAFLVAGAGAVVCAVQPIDDDEASAFQQAFYAQLRRGDGPVESLVACQRACVRGELGAEMREVDAWAPYVLYGVL